LITLLLEFNLALRFFHWFIRGAVSTFDEKNFLVPNGLRGKRSIDIEISKAIDNLTFYKENICGITHGLLDTSWNLGQLSDNVSDCQVYRSN